MSAREDIAHMTPQEAAFFWRARLGSDQCTRADRAAFEDWRAADPAHEAAIAEFDDFLEEVDAAGETSDIGELRAAAVAAAARAKRGRGAVRWAAAAAAGLLLAVAAGVAALQIDFTPDTGQYATGLGERSAITLADGSTVTLNTSTRLAVDFRGPERAVTLLEGQALFEVAKDPSRPFVVTAGDRQVTALGTAFDVRLDADEVRVTLVEGRVSVTPVAKPQLVEAALIEPPSVPTASLKAAPAAPEPLAEKAELVPGEQLIASAEAVDVRAANVERVVSWRDGWLVFEEDRLADAVAEVNRYSPIRLVVEDAELGETQVSGVFRTGETASFIDALEDYLHVKARRRAGGEIALTAGG